MITNLSHVMTLANGVIGVSVLAMPYCFKQCGIVLSILMILLSGLLSKFACHLLVKSAVMSRRRNFEFLAFHAFGRAGKFFAELFIIGFLMGTCIAFFVVVGDLGPEIVGKMVDASPAGIRTSLLVTIAVFVILPLGLLRNVDSLSSICTATIGFYLCLVTKVMTESMTHIFATDWYDKVFYWRPSGILQCLPIFSMALFCQTQLFEIYETIPNVCLEKMNHVVRVALNICTVVYVCVGFFGYVAFCNLPFTGNILMSFEPSLSSEAIKIGFVLSVAFSFPLVIFPCRASLNSLLFRWAHSHETSSNYIPETRFRWMTILIVSVSLITGILIPNIEFVLGLLGSTIGVMICLMFPAAFFISISSKNTNERLVAQAMLFVGVWIMILGTYANLYAMEESANAKITVTTGESLSQLNNIPLINAGDAQVVPPVPEMIVPHLDVAKFQTLEVEKVHDPGSKDDGRQEPPIPVERDVVDKKPEPTLSPAIEEIVEKMKKMDENKEKQAGEEKRKLETGVGNEEGKGGPVPKVETKDTQDDKNVVPNANNFIHSDAIQKEESELAAANLDADAERAASYEESRKAIEKYYNAQRQMLQEQKKILNTIQKREEFAQQEKRKITSKKKPEHDKKDAGIEAAVESTKNQPENNLNNLRADTKPVLRESKAENPGNEFPQVVRKKSKDTKADNESVRAKKEAIKLEVPSPGENAKDRTTKKSRGPILSALAKQVQNSSKANAVQTDINQKIEPATKVPKTDEKHLLNNSNAPVPIALAMSNQTKKDSAKATKKNDENPAIGRDILQSLDRKKRAVNENQTPKIGKENNVQALAISDIAQRDLVDQECSKTEESPHNNDNSNNNNVNKKGPVKSEKENRSSKERVTTELPLIKTNSYLSDQGFVDSNSLDKNMDLKDFEKSNHRDLKSVSSTNENRK